MTKDSKIKIAITFVLSGFVLLVVFGMLPKSKDCYKELAPRLWLLGRYASISFSKSLMVNVKSYGAIGDGISDDTRAMQAAHANNRPVYYPIGNYIYSGYFPSCHGGLIGEGVNRTVIKFRNCNDPTKASITINLSKSHSFRIENLTIKAESWDETTGCTGYGIDACSPVYFSNVVVSDFKRSNLFLHVWKSNAPYNSLFVNVQSSNSGQHGCVVGYGSNCVTFINYSGYNNGRTSYRGKVANPGQYDGFYVDYTDDSNKQNGGNYINPLSTGTTGGTVPVSLTVIGGDCSYNSRYGWNFQRVMCSSLLSPGYAEQNHLNQAHIGEGVRWCRIFFSDLEGMTAGLIDDSVLTNASTNSVYIGGFLKKCGK